MLWTYKGNQLIIYNVEIDVEQIKNILIDIILKDCSALNNNTVLEENINIENKKIKTGRYFMQVYDKDELEIKNKGINYSMLINILEKILRNDIRAIVKLYKCRNIENAEKYIEYIDATLKNINLVPIYTNTFINSFDMLEKLIKHGNNSIRESVEEIQKIMIPYEIIKKIDNRKSYQKK